MRTFSSILPFTNRLGWQEAVRFVNLITLLIVLSIIYSLPVYAADEESMGQGIWEWVVKWESQFLCIVVGVVAGIATCVLVARFGITKTILFAIFMVGIWICLIIFVELPSITLTDYVLGGAVFWLTARFLRFVFTIPLRWRLARDYYIPRSTEATSHENISALFWTACGLFFQDESPQWWNDRYAQLTDENKKLQGENRFVKLDKDEILLGNGGAEEKWWIWGWQGRGNTSRGMNVIVILVLLFAAFVWGCIVGAAYAV